MNAFQENLITLLKDKGAALLGFAQLQTITDGRWKSGLAIATAIPRHVIRSISDGPTLPYYEAYNSLNATLHSLALEAEAYIKSHGYHALAQTKDVVKQGPDYRTPMPHKTIAVHAGLGWIGKSALLVTPEFGSAVRLTSVLTDAEFDYGTPITSSRCGSCTNCTNACPGNAVSGKNWAPDIDRDEFYNPYSCRKTARKLAFDMLNKEVTLCGKCIEVCPYTQKYLSSGTD
ncbi:4Fe-4S dicluster domain-containing protein [Blautia schinkii]|nr:4Fe-4S dicluster domain-containing protein [Blautia schinkii]